MRGWVRTVCAIDLAILTSLSSADSGAVREASTSTAPVITVRRVIAAPIPTPIPTPEPTPLPLLAFAVATGEGVALTFDDGPDPRATPRILDLLEARGVRGTFFVVGSQAAKYPELVRSIAARGHGVAGHTWSHRKLTMLSGDGWQWEVDFANEYLKQLTGRPVRCVRPPGGSYDAGVLAKLGERGLAAALWTVDARDWTKPGAELIVARAMFDLRPGAVILLHDGGGYREQTVQALPKILDIVLASGLEVEPICR